MPYSGGDPFRDALRNELDAIITAASIAWEQVDTLNTDEDPDASVPGYIELEFPGSSEAQETFGAPGFNEFREQGQVTVRVVTPLGGDRNTAETYARAIRDRFRGIDIAYTQYGPNRAIHIDAVSSMGGGHTEGGMWAESVALAYRVYNLG